jgi:transposase
MALGHRLPKTLPDWIATAALAPAPANPFYQRLNEILQEADFDTFLEDLCRPYYADGIGRRGIPPGIYFRMLFVGYFEGFGSQRAIAWHCADSRSLREFLGYLPTELTPDHSSLTKVRQRLPEIVHEQVFAWVMQLAQTKGLRPGKTAGVDSTFLEANASMKTIERRDTGDDWKAYLRKLAAEAGIANPSDEDLRRLDRQRKDKKVSNEEWVSPTDPESRITKMKDGTTHLAYKAEHVVDLKTDLVLAAEVYPADQPDSATLLPSVVTAQLNLFRAERVASRAEAVTDPGGATDRVPVVAEAVTDKGYHKVETLVDCAAAGVRTYTGEQRRPQGHVWSDKPAGWEKAYRANRRRNRSVRGKRLQKRRSEYVERTFAHVCETGGGRRSWLRGLLDVSKRYLMQVAGHNLGVLMRRLFGKGTPRGLQGTCVALLAWLWTWGTVWLARATAPARSLASKVIAAGYEKPHSWPIAVH